MDDQLRIRTRLDGARAMRNELLATAAAVKTVGDASLVTGRNMDEGGRRSFLYGQGLFTLRRAAYGLTLGLGGLGTAALTMGIRFDASMEQNRISLTYFLGSVGAANRELAFLYQLAAKTPFEFGQVTDAARRFLAFGFTLQQTNDYLRTLGDTAAGLGLGGEDVARLAIILGQIKSSGRLLGQDTLQLAQAGINARGILQKQLGLSAAQMLALGQGTLTIPADVAIPALMRGLQERFRGMAALQANTGAGLWSTTRDYTRQFLGSLTGSLFERGKSNLKSLNVILQEMSKTLMPRSLGGRGGSFEDALGVLDRGVGANGQIVEAWRELRAVGQDLFRIVTYLGPAFGALWATLGLGSPPMRLLVGLLGFLSRHMTAVLIVTGLLSAELIYNRGVLLLSFLATRGLTIGYFLLGRAILFMTAVTWLWNAALDANPIVLIILGVALLAAGLAYLIIRIDAVRGAFGTAFGWIKREFVALINILIDGLNWFISHLTLGGLWDFLAPKVGLPKIPTIPHLDTGGDITRTGLAVVHRGETVLPTRAEVKPLGSTGGFTLADLAAAIVDALSAVRIEAADINMDARKVGEATFRYKADVAAS